MKTGKPLYISAILFLLIIGATLSFMFITPVKIGYIEQDSEPGYTAGDEMLSMEGMTQVQSMVKYPNYYVGMAIALALGVAGFIYTVTAWEKTRENEKESDICVDTGG